MARGCFCSDQGLLEPHFVKIPPGLFFSQGDRFKIRHTQKYAISEAKKADKIPCVITMRVNEANFRHVYRRIWNAKAVLDQFRKMRTQYEPEFMQPKTLAEYENWIKDLKSNVN